MLVLQRLVMVFSACLIAFSAVSNISIWAQLEQSDVDTSELFVFEAVSVSLDLVEQGIDAADLKYAKSLTKVTTEIFPPHLQNLRQSDADIADEIHVLLLDIHSGIGTTDASKILEDIGTVRGLLDQYQADSPDYGMVIALLLTVADDRYHAAEHDRALYDLCKELVGRAHILLPNTSYDQRLMQETDSFLEELGQKIADKDDFVSVGTLVSALVRDLVGHESTVYDKQKLYDTIRKIYGEMSIALDAGNYSKAEGLAIEAYLENFEYLEADIERVNPDLLYTLEIDMRENLRNMIKENDDVQEIKSFVDITILPKLDTAEAQVGQMTPVTGNDTPKKELKEMGDATDEEKSGVRGEIDFIRDTLQEMLLQYDSGEYQLAYTSARTAYLDSYEFVEIPLRTIDPDFTLEVEFQFAQLRNMIKERADYDQVQDVAISIKRSLDESERLVTGTGMLAPAIAFTTSFAIIFREGLESVLILGAILTYLEASRNGRFKKHIYYGVIGAIAATGVTWFLASYVIGISGANRELIEAVAALSATVMLFYVSFWVLNKIEHKKWMEFVKAKVWQATTTGSVMVFVMLSFFTVYREGFETVLFYQAMSGFAKYMEAYVGLGFAVGMAVLFVIYYVMRRLGKRLPLRALFGLTMGVGAYMSIAFLGNAVRELQVLEIVPYTSMFGIIPRLDINIAAMTGIYPTLETVIAQAILIAIYLVASTYVLILKPRREKSLASMRKSHRAKAHG